MNAPQQRRPASAGLLARLMEAVRPEFRGEVFHVPCDSPVFFQGTCRVAACTTAQGYAARGLCTGHYVRWKQASKQPGYPGMEAWLAAEEADTLRRGAPPPACQVAGCNRAVKSRGICHRHHWQWVRAGAPTQPGWVEAMGYQAPAGGERTCAYPACPRWTDGARMQLCRSHWNRWRRRGGPDLAAWFAEESHGRNPRIRFDGLSAQLKLEVQFGLQCRYDEGTKHTALRFVTRTISWAKAAGVSRRGWPASPRRTPAPWQSSTGSSARSSRPAPSRSWPAER